MLPKGVAQHLKSYTQLARAYKALNAAVGPCALATLRISTVALESNDDDATELESELAGDGSRRDTLTGRMQAILDGTMFGGGRYHRTQASPWLKQSQNRLTRVQANSTANS